MKFSKTISFVFILATLLLSSGAAMASANAQVANQSAHIKGSLSPTYLGPASQVLLKGPMRTLPQVVSPAVHSTLPTSAANLPSTNAKPGAVEAGTVGPSTCITYVNCFILPLPISCTTVGTGCDTLSGASPATSAPGLNAVDSGGLYGTDIEPPDQGLCAGAGYVVEALNLGELRVYNTALQGLSSDISADSLMGLPSMPPSGWSSGGDIQCLYDYNNGGHWFVTEFVSTNPEIAGGPFAGCFAGAKNGCLEGLAVSVSSDPLGAWNVYFVNPNWNPSEPGNGYLLNDYAKISTTRDAFLLFYDEYNLNPATYPACPAFGCAGFNGAQELAFNKKALELGWPVMVPYGGPNAYFNVAVANMGLLPTPEPPPFNTCGQNSPVPGYASCWYQVIPAQSPDPTQFDNTHGGMGYMLASLDFFGGGDNRVSVFYWSGLSSLNTLNPMVFFGGTTLTTTTPYRDEGAACYPGTLTSFCGLGVQKAGPVPLGDTNMSGLGGGPEWGIATNGDGATQASFANHQLWFTVSTLVDQTFAGGVMELHIGAAFYAVGTTAFDGGGALTVSSQGYVTTAHEDMEFPALAASDGPITIMSFTLSGVDYYPSSAYGTMSTGTHGLAFSKYMIAALGQAPQDGFTEYPAGGFRPRWGDYGAAIYVPSTPGSAIGHTFFASEMIQSPACTDAAFLADPSCGGTRDPFANWGTSINSIPA